MSERLIPKPDFGRKREPSQHELDYLDALALKAKIDATRETVYQTDRRRLRNDWLQTLFGFIVAIIFLAIWL